MAEHPALVGIRPSMNKLFVAPCLQVSQTTQCSEAVLAAAAVVLAAAVSVLAVAAPAVLSVVHSLAELLH